MSLLNTLSRPKVNPPVITIMGDAGVGKTTLASLFPKPVFITTELGLNSVADNENVLAFEPANTYKDVLEQINCLINEEHDFKTLVIDSISRLDQMIMNEILVQDRAECKREGKKLPKSINQACGGFGNGGETVSTWHYRVRSGCKRLNEEKGMAIVFIGHSHVQTETLPDLDTFSFFDLKIHRKAKAHYIDNVDLVGFLRVKGFVNGSDDDDKPSKVLSSGQRALICHANLAYVTKNRYGIDSEFILRKGENPLAFLFKDKSEK